MLFEIDFTSSKLLASLTPPPLPRPPACTWAFTTNQVDPVVSVSFFAHSTASSEF